MSNIEVDSIVIKRHGKLPIKVTSIYNSSLNGVYLHSGSSVNGRTSDFKLYEGKEEMASKNSKYIVTLADDSTFVGMYCGTNSSGLYIMEDNVTNKIVTVEPSQVKEILPYTFGVYANNSSQMAHFKCEEGRVKVGELLIMHSYNNFTIVKVAQLNTQSKTAKTFKGYKLVTEEF